jgi:adenylate cyclase
MARGYTDDVDTSWKEASTALQRAVALDENDVECHRILCEVNMSSRDWEAAELHHNKAFELNPNDPRLAAQRGELLTWMGKAEEGAEWIRKAIRLDPYEAHLRAHLLGRSLYALRDYEGALSAFRQIPSPRYRHLADMAAISAQMGQGARRQGARARARFHDNGLYGGPCLSRGRGPRASSGRPTQVWSAGVAPYLRSAAH